MLEIERIFDNKKNNETNQQTIESTHSQCKFYFISKFAPKVYKKNRKKGEKNFNFLISFTFVSF